MANNSPIEWTDATWNPIVGCSIISPGCTNCYAMKMASRIEAMGNQPRYAGTTRKVNGNAIWTGKLAQAPDSVLLAPLKRKKPTTYFVNSMGDLFHEDCPDEWIDRVFAVMALAPQHTFQVLTKRSERMRDYFDGGRDRADIVGLAMLTIVDRIPHGHRRVPWPLPNVWLGVSTERQEEADERIPLLLQTPAAVRFISAEPLLGPIDLMEVIPNPIIYNVIHGMERLLDWVIVGGESGSNARPMHPDWARALRDQCKATGTNFFFKQWGAWKPLDQFEDKVIKLAGVHAVVRDDGRFVVDTDIADPPRSVFTFKMGKHSAGRHLDGVLHDAMPQRSQLKDHAKEESKCV